MRRFFIVAIVLSFTGTIWAQTPIPAGHSQESPFAERFRQADTNGDGVIDDAEAHSAGLWFKDDFNSVDTDRSGTVTALELGQALQQRLNRWLADFDAADTDHDGRLSEDEVKRVPSLAEVLTHIAPAKHPAVSRPEYESYAIERLYRDSELPVVAPNIIEKRF